MSYTPVKTVTDGESWTAKDMNRYIRDNFAAGVPDLMTMKGDLVAASGADAGVRVGVNAINFSRFVAASGEAGGVKWVPPGAARLWVGGDGVSGVITGFLDTSCFTTEIIDSDAASTRSTSGSVHWYFTVPTTGYYLIGTVLSLGYTNSLVLDSGVWGINDYCYVKLFEAGGEKSVLLHDYTQTGNEFRHSVDGMDIAYLTAGNTVELKHYHTNDENETKYHQGSTVFIKLLGI